MFYVLCSVFDKQSRQFSAPFVSYTQETAVRDFARAVRDSKGMPDKFPVDFELYAVGGWQSDNGNVAQADIPTLLAKGVDFIDKE